MSTVLVSGTDESTATIVEALESTGETAIVVHPRGDVADALASLPDQKVDHYVQMPVTVTVPRGSGSVGAVRAFLEDGLIARFVIAESVLPHLAEGATVLLVTGNEAIGGEGGGAVTGAPDDRSARVSLLRVLGRSISDDRGDLRLQVVDRSVGSQRLAACAVSGEPASDPGDIPESEMDFEDWRTQMVGSVTSEF